VWLVSDGIYVHRPDQASVDACAAAGVPTIGRLNPQINTDLQARPLA
jgi:hypothetical protein